MQVTQKEMDLFKVFSYDTNPLHCDKIYSQKTQFGSIVVYGIAILCKSLGEVLGDKKFKISRLQAQFNRPHSFDYDYELKSSINGNKVKIEIMKKDIVYSSFKLQIADYNGVDTDNNIKSNFCALTTPSLSWSKEDSSLNNKVYLFNLEHLKSFEEAFGIGADVLPLFQLNTIIWTSYYVGMQVPGKQALYSYLNIQFDENIPLNTEVKINELSVNQHPVFKQITTKGKITGLKSFEIQAFERPEPLQYNMNDLKESMTINDDEKMNNIFITGSSRGLGSILARAYALKGANLYLNYRSEGEALENLKEDLTSNQTEFITMKADILNSDDWDKMINQIQIKGEKIHKLILNASPHIYKKYFMEQETQEMLEFINNSLTCVIFPLKRLMPFLSKNAEVILISSIYVNESEKELSHYISAKLAQEGIMKVMAKEYPNLRFHIARFPRIKTDQNNIPYDINPPISPIDLMNSFFKETESGRQEEINLNTYELSP